MPMRLVAVLLVTTACAKNVARDEALVRASAARTRGDFVGEALALRDACAAAPNDREVCLQANQQWQAAQQRSMQIARERCRDIPATTEGVDTCLAAVTEIRKLAPGDGEAARLAELASKAHLQRCFADSPQWQTQVEAAVELIRCEESRAALIDLPLYRQQVWAARANAKEQLVRLADHPAYQDKAGAAYELLAASMCLTPTPDLIERAEAARGILVDKHRASVDLRLTQSVPLFDLCKTATALLDTRAVCGGPKPGAPNITIVGELTISPVEHAARESTESRDYVAGVIRFENPDYHPAVADERSARMSMDSAEQQYRRDESDCRSAESRLSSAGSSCSSSCPERTDRDIACNRKASSESMFRSRESDWRSAKSRLDRTPAISERDDIRTATYSVRHHAWVAAWSAQLRSDGRTFTVTGEAETTDRETEGAPVAGVPADPLTRPGKHWFVRSIRDQAARKLAEAIDTALKRRASDLVVSCTPPYQWNADWLDCWARARFWGGQPAQADALLALVGTDSPWPALACAR